MHTPEPEEILDLVDERDIVIGAIKRNDLDQRTHGHFRAVCGFIVNDKGQLFIPRRAASKKLFPLGLDTSMGGHVQTGETYHEAFKRELFEELGLDTDKLSYKLLGLLSPIHHKTRAFCQIYQIHLNQTPTYTPDEFIEHFWLTPTEVCERISGGELHKHDLIPTLHTLYAPKNNNCSCLSITYTPPTK